MVPVRSRVFPRTARSGVALPIVVATVLLAWALPAAAKPTTTTTAPVARPTPGTTTTLVPIQIPDHGGSTVPAPPGATSTTTVPIIPVAPGVINALVRSVQGGLAELDAIDAYDQDKGIVTAEIANVANADLNADLAEQGEAEAQTEVAAAQAGYNDSAHSLASVGVALYIRADVGNAAKNASAANPENLNTAVLLSLLISRGQRQFEIAKQALRAANQHLRRAEQRVEVAKAEQTLAHQNLTKSTAKLTDAKLAAAGQTVKATTGTPIPTIMGPPAVSADELAGWYASTGYQPNITVSMPTLTGYYLDSGTKAGLRGDIAFAQSIVETGYFTFPSYGQVARADNNFAGIGACDSCAHGWRFPTAQTGVAAQVQLLQAYASSTKIPTPLVGRVDVAGCCSTWLALSGVWATNPNYGYAILSVYQQILNWAIPVRLAASGL